MAEKRIPEKQWGTTEEDMPIENGRSELGSGRSGIASLAKYLEIARISFKTRLVWRFEVVINMLFTVSKIIFAYILWTAIFSANETVAGFSFSSMLSYYMIHSFLSGLDMSQKVGEEICNKVVSGGFSKYMVIPTNIQGYFLAQSLGAGLFYTAFHFIAAFVWVFLFQIPLTFTANPFQIGGALLLVGLGLIFMVQLHFFIGILAFRFVSVSFLRMIVENIVEFLSGSMVPLILLPAALLNILRCLPVYYATYLPTMLLLDRCQEEMASGIGIMVFWVALFTCINKLMYKVMRTKYEGVGI